MQHPFAPAVQRRDTRQAEDQKNRTEAVSALMELVTTLGPFLQAPGAMELLKDTGLFLLGGFKAGAKLEDTLEKLAGGAASGAGGVAGVPSGEDSQAGADVVSL